MRIVETRVLEGPNVFLLEPAVKVEFAGEGDVLSASELLRVQQLAELIEKLSVDAGQTPPNVVVETMETPGHVALAFGWSHRRFAEALADAAAKAVIAGGPPPGFAADAKATLSEFLSGDRPQMIPDAIRTKLTIGITGTNGKTTTTRLIAHLFRSAGRHVGWSCSSGVYIDGEEVLAGDYSGPRGAQRVIEDVVAEVGVIELARGGILLRGIACQSLDVSVFTNISADHLDLQGIRTVQGLARAKSLVPRITRADGFAIVNADDPLVMEYTIGIAAERVLFSRQPDSARLIEHIDQGGKALLHQSGAFVWIDQWNQTRLVEVDEVPMIYGGTAGFMVENALAGAAAALMGGLTHEQVRNGLASFDNDSDKNPGRLNVYDLDGVTVVLDYAHNEAGLLALLAFARSLIGTGGEVYSVVGTAGDRTDESIRELGRIAAHSSDHVIAKDTSKYLRGRVAEELMGLYADGARSENGSTYEEAADELAAVKRALDRAKSGDVVAIMSHESAREIGQMIIERGGHPR